jgi:hypothetical protein
MSGARIRQKFAKKRRLHGVNEHFSQIFSAIIVPRSSRAKMSLIICFAARHQQYWRGKPASPVKQPPGS